MKLHPGLPSLAWLLLSIPTAGGQVVDLDHPCRARLLADTAAVEAGKPFRIGVLLEHDRGWHTYWHSPRDGANPIAVEWRLPEGYVVSPLRWPVPQRFREPGDLVAYGYSDRVLLQATVTPPARVEDTVRLGAKVDWMVCEKVCLVGSARPRLDLPGGAAPSVESPHASLFDQWSRRVPEEPAALATRVRHRWERKSKSAGTWTLEWESVGDWPSKAQVLPHDLAIGEISEPEVSITQETHPEGRIVRGTAVFQITIGGPEFDPHGLAAVVIYDLPPPDPKTKSRPVRAFETRYPREKKP